jgi:putative peptidoglycan lipid II flippase
MVALIFQHGNFTAGDTTATALAVRFNLPGLIFAALDQPLIFAFYARKNTWTPALVGVITVVLYAAMAFIPTLYHAPQLSELILANSLKLTAHALLMLYLFYKMVGSLKPYHVSRTTFLATLAALIAALVAWGSLTFLHPEPTDGFVEFLVQLIIPGGLGAAAYLGMLRLMGIEEVMILRRALLQRWPTRK